MQDLCTIVTVHVGQNQSTFVTVVLRASLNDDIKMPAFVPDGIRTFQPSLGTPEALYPVAIRLFIYMDIHVHIPHSIQRMLT